LSWQLEWTELSKRISGLLEAGKFLFGYVSDNRESVSRAIFLPHSKEVFLIIQGLLDRHRSVLPPQAVSSLERFAQSRPYFVGDPSSRSAPVRVAEHQLTLLASFQAEFSYHLSDFDASVHRISERAFLHLQRSIVADPEFQRRWQCAYDSGEPACERLGAAHLLWHGIWAFKGHSAGERTDLIMGDRLDPSAAQGSAIALVLTEWKKVSHERGLDSIAKKARDQAALYGAGSLAGFELSTYRYLVFVSKNRLPQLPDRNEAGVIYRYINIAVNPATPSKARRPRGR
jgi:hypothetical protein